MSVFGLICGAGHQPVRRGQPDIRRAAVAGDGPGRAAHRDGGLPAGTNYLQTRFVGMRSFGEAFAMQVVAQGIAMALTPPLFGMIYEWTGSYAPMYWSVFVGSARRRRRLPDARAVSVRQRPRRNRAKPCTAGTKRAVPAPEVQQRFAFARARGLHQPDHDGVIAADEDLAGRAFDLRQRIGDQRHAELLRRSRSACRRVLSCPFTAKRVAMSAWPAPSTLTPKCRQETIAG